MPGLPALEMKMYSAEFRQIKCRQHTNALTALYTGGLPCLDHHHTMLSVCNDAVASLHVHLPCRLKTHSVPFD